LFPKLIQMKFADVKNDVAFRKIFGNKKKTQILIAYDNTLIVKQDKKGRIAAAKNKGREEEKIENIIGLNENGVPVSIIAKSLKISEAEVLKIISTAK
jgi:hypothetical protein